jgi:VanZ family protein
LAIHAIKGQPTHRQPQKESAAPLARVLLIAAALVIAVLTLYPFDFSFTVERWADVLVWHGREKVFDLIVNLLLFCPFGAAGFFALRHPLRPLRAAIVTVLMGFGLSLTIETLQAFDRGRDSSVNDVILNAISTMLGLWIARAVEPVLARRRWGRGG